MSKYGNSRANQKTEEIKSSVDLNSDSDILTSRCKFNFHYFDNSNAGQDFQDWTKEELSDLLNKLKFYSENSLEYWKKNLLAVQVMYYKYMASFLYQQKQILKNLSMYLIKLNGEDLD